LKNWSLFVSNLAGKQKNPSPGGDGLGKVRVDSAVVADGFHRTAFLRFLAPTFLFLVFRLLKDDGITAIIIPLEIVRSGFAAEIAVYALIVYEILAGHIFRISIRWICHKKIGCILILSRRKN